MMIDSFNGTLVSLPTCPAQGGQKLTYHSIKRQIFFPILMVKTFTRLLSSYTTKHSADTAACFKFSVKIKFNNIVHCLSHVHLT